jgi:hypothetical protein
MTIRRNPTGVFLLTSLIFGPARAQEVLFPDPVNVDVPRISDDTSIRYDYDIVYVRADRAGDELHKRFYTDFSQPVTLEPGADLMLLHPDGDEELLVDGGDGSVTDPTISFDGQWAYYTLIHDLRNHNQWNPPRRGADVYEIHLKSTTRTTAVSAPTSRCRRFPPTVIPPSDPRTWTTLAIDRGDTVASKTPRPNGIECRSCPPVPSR